MKKIDFKDVRRQPYLDELSYKNTLSHIASAQQDYAEVLTDPPYSSAVREAYQLMAADALDSFMLRFTGGERLEDLATQLESVVEAYERYVEQCSLVPEAEYFPTKENSCLHSMHRSTARQSGSGIPLPEHRA